MMRLFIRAVPSAVRQSLRWLSPVLLLLILCASGQAQAPGGGGLVERIVRFFVDAADPEEEEEVAIAAVPAQAEGNRAPAEIAARQKRLDAWCRATESFYTASLELTDEQQAELRRLMTTEAALNQQRWKRQNDDNNHNQYLSDTIVILFAGNSGPVRRVLRATDRKLTDLLTNEQKAQLPELVQRRSQRTKEWFARRATSVVNSELFLSKEQLQSCYDDLLRQVSVRSNGLYAFHQQHYYLPYEQLSAFLRRMKGVELSAIQQQRLDDLKQDDSGNQHVMVTINSDSEEQNEQQVNEVALQARQRYLNAAAVRAEYLTTSLQLQDREARHLQVAGKGVTVRRLNEWKKQTRRQIQEFAKNPRFGGGMTIGLSGPSLESLAFEQDRIWRRAVNKVCGSPDTECLAAHRDAEREGAAAFVMATLDRELMLRDKQLDRLQQLVEETQPHRVPKSQYYYLELGMVARTLLYLDEAELKNLIDEPQMECWKLMKSQFRFQGRRSARFHTRHGEMHISLGGD